MMIAAAGQINLVALIDEEGTEVRSPETVGQEKDIRHLRTETLSVKISSIRLQGESYIELRRDSVNDAYFQVTENNKNIGHNRVCTWNM
jgi:hypothetical protein